LPPRAAALVFEYPKVYGRDDVRRELNADPNPMRNPYRLLGRVYHRLKERVAA
jgi:hypothetical protein